MKLNDFDALTFDCYGTLIDWERGIVNKLRPWTVQHGLALSDDELLETFGELEPKHQAATPGKLYPDILASIYRELALRWEIPTNEESAIAFGKSIERWPAFNDSATSLQYLKKHYKLVIISNVDRDSFARSNEKLEVKFDRIITAQDVGTYKPDPRNFEYMINQLAQMGVSKGKIDIVPATAVGLTTMWINRRKHKTGSGATAVVTENIQPDFEVASLAEFVSMHQAELRA
jgi:2-haloalkanoic acid dehalogenase type II